jgi:hypothetical protein
MGAPSRDLKFPPSKAYGILKEKIIGSNRDKSGF